MKILEAIEDLVIHYESQKKSDKTTKNLKFRLVVFQFYMKERYNIESVNLIRATHLQDYQLYLAGQTDQHGNSWTPKYVNVHNWALRSLLDYLWKYKYIGLELSIYIENVKEPQRLPQYVMDQKEVNLLLSQIDTSSDIGYRDYVIINLLASSGIRVQECSMLDLGDVNLQRRELFIKHGKGDKQRLAVFSEQCKKLLQNYLSTVRPFWKNNELSNSLFIGNRGDRFSIKGIETMMKKYVKQAGLNPKYTPHSLRKYLVTELAKANANPYHIKELMGWDSLRPMNNYAKLHPGDLKKTLDECLSLEQKVG